MSWPGYTIHTVETCWLGWSLGVADLEGAGEGDDSGTPRGCWLCCCCMSCHQGARSRDRASCEGLNGIVYRAVLM
jgi:hypothetical protein